MVRVDIILILRFNPQGKGLTAFDVTFKGVSASTRVYLRVKDGSSKECS